MIRHDSMPQFEARRFPKAAESAGRIERNSAAGLMVTPSPFRQSTGTHISLTSKRASSVFQYEASAVF